MANPTLSKPSDPIQSIQAFAQLFRMPTGILAALAGCATIFDLNPTVPLRSYLLTAVILACMTSAACTINDYWDTDKDRIDHGERPLPSGRLTLLVLLAAAPPF